MIDPLAGERVLDLTRFVSGPYATMLLGALGAEVIKIEVPPDGDPYRHQGSSRVGSQSALFLSLNNGKRSLAVDFRTEEGRQIIERLLATTTIVVENGVPGALVKRQLDFESVHARHPRIVYASLSGYGETGPSAGRGGFDLTLQAEGGLMSVTGSPESGPVKVGIPLLDIGSSLTCVIGLLAAVIERNRTGVGSHVATSLLEFSLAGFTTVAADHFAGGAVPGLLGTHSPSFAPYGAFRTASGTIVLAGAGSEELWARLCSALGVDALIADPRFVDNAARLRNRDALTSILENALQAHTAEEWTEILEGAGVPTGAVRDLEEVVNSSQVEALEMIQTLDHPSAGRYRSVRPPLRRNGAPMRLKGAAPELGADSRDLLAELGLAASEIDALRARGVVAWS